jgi:hypothetical protein
MRLSILVSLLLATSLVAACGGDDKKGGLLSGLNKDASSSQGPSGGNPALQDPKALATTIAQVTGSSGSAPSVPGLTQDPRALATTIAALTGGAGSVPNIQGLTQDPKALATAIAALSSLGGVNDPKLPSLPAGAQGNTSATPDPCALLSLDDVMTVLKSKNVELDKDPPSTNAMGSRECSYSGTGTNPSSVSLTVYSTAGLSPQLRSAGYTAKKQYDELKKTTKNPTMVPGIGEEAYIDGFFIHVLKKDVTFDLLIFTLGDSAEALKAAATRVAAKLP